jgi:rhodanese-related sulfurtransferase
MKLIIALRSKSHLIIAALILGLSIQAHAAEGNDGTHKAHETYNSFSVIPEKLFNPKPKQRESAFAISPDRLLSKLKQKQPLTLVDVRNTDDFQRLHIPGSLNIPLYAVKTKVFLKSFPMVLINEGFQHSLLESECRQLKDMGFDVLILDGGVTAWAQKGNALVGDLFALEDMQMISPQVFYREKDRQNVLVIDISPVQLEISKQLMPYSIHLPIPGEQGQWAPVLGRLTDSHRTPPFLSILVLNQTGDGYDRAKKIFAGLSVNAFYLQSGMVGYQRYLEDIMLSWVPRDDRIKTEKPCEICSQIVGEKLVTDAIEK